MRMGQIYNLYTRLPTFLSAYKQINKQYNNHYNPLVWILKPLFFFLSILKEKNLFYSFTPRINMDKLLSVVQTYNLD